MPYYLNHPPIQKLIASIPVEEHGVAVSAEFWREPCARSERTALHDAMFAGRPAVRIPRSWLRRDDGIDPELRTLGVLLWGYPRGARGNRHVQWLEKLPAIAAAAAAPVATWDEYYHRLAGTGPLGISTISKLAHFLGHTFDGHRALILDQRIISLCAGGRWTELESLSSLSYPVAHRRYPDYLALMHTIARAGGFSAEQLEFFLFSLGESF
jgi:hypothetical protein